MDEIVLPWPDRKLHPNTPAHWAVRAKVKKKARRDAHLIAKAAGWHQTRWPEGRLHVWIDGYAETMTVSSPASRRILTAWRTPWAWMTVGSFRTPTSKTKHGTRQRCGYG